MNNYICINGKKLELTDEQIQLLGVVEAPQTLDEIKRLVHEGANGYGIGNKFNVGGVELEIIGIGHDADENGDCDTITFMGTHLLEKRRMNNGQCDGGWKDTELRAWLNDEFYGFIPDSIKKHIRKCIKDCVLPDGSHETVCDYLFIPSETEMFGSAIYSGAEEGKRYPAFSDSDTRIRLDDDDDGDWYWTRSSNAGSAARFCYVYNDGIPSYASATTTHIRVPLCFII